jgi:hypothetical protein
MPAIPGTILAAKISPGDTTATFPTHEDIYGKGGLMSVSTMDELTSLPLDRQKTGMLVYVNSNTHHYTLTSLSYPLTGYNVWESAIDLNNTLIRNLYVGDSITPITGNRIVVNGGNIRVNGIDLSNVPNITSFDTDGQSLFDLRSASANANYNLSIASSGVDNFIKFFGGRQTDPNAFIVVKTGSPLRIASYSNFYNSNNDFTEHMRVDTQTGNIGIGTQNPTQKLSVNGSISSNNIVYANDITVTNNLSASVHITDLTTTKTFLSTDTCRVFHFDTTTQPLCAIFPSTLPDGFNVAVMNTGTNNLRLSAAQLNSVGVTIGAQYGGAFIYKDNNQLFAVGRL